MLIGIDFLEQQRYEERMILLRLEALRGIVSKPEKQFLKKLPRQFKIESISFAGKGNFIRDSDEEYHYEPKSKTGFKYLIRYRDITGKKFNWVCL
jgi:hypothetical protein